MTASQVVPHIQDVPPVGDRRRRAAGGNGADGPHPLLPDEGPGSECRRLVVLVPESGIEVSGLVEELRALAVPPFVEVLFVGLGRSTPGSRTERRLAELTSKAQDLPVVKRQQVVAASYWLKAVQIVARPGDVIICHARQQAGGLAEELAEMTPFPVYLLSSGRPTLAGRLTRRLGRLAFDLFPLAVAAAFFWLQLRIDAQTTGLVNTLAILLTVVVEFGLIFLWSLFLPR